ncbi:MAG: DUF488 domain-containing protein [Bacteroidia bacterium]|nr:DUF488 domain-containing protein [Bacteroidia bacterium]MCZ2249439.1 DUF488 domain-containing protein [Bacteroidia bacterium]
MKLKIKRVYDKPQTNDGYRLLIDRLWPRGISKEEAKLDEWLKDIAPSNELRKWFNHIPERFEEFKKKYADELKPQHETLLRIKKMAEKQNLTLLYSAKDTQHNNAVVLEELIKKLK